MWVDRFGLEHLSVDDSSILFTPHSAKQIGIICGLMKKKMKLEDVRKYLDSVSGNCD
jgi:hypothetical protein